MAPMTVPSCHVMADWQASGVSDRRLLCAPAGAAAAVALHAVKVLVGWVKASMTVKSVMLAPFQLSTACCRQRHDSLGKHYTDLDGNPQHRSVPAERAGMRQAHSKLTFAFAEQSPRGSWVHADLGRASSPIGLRSGWYCN